ncbi:MAG: lyase [Hyphomicrobiales bacterium]|nr:lyase [Hyphomicrobiales bacterium]
MQTDVYDVPAGARPHDVAPAPDGKVWYTAQRQGALGILDPETREIVQIPLGEDSSPHGVIQGPDGNAWITDSGQNAIVRYDPSTDEVTVWPLPDDTGYTNLNTAAFDGDGFIWFTGQNGFYGRLDPFTGRMDVYSAPSGRGPYGIAATPQGEIYYASLAGNYIAHIDRKTGEAKVIEPPTQGQGARRVWSDSKGHIWVSEWNSGQLSRFDPARNEWAVFNLPGDGAKAYAVYVDERDIIWVSDFGANATLAFDPESESFIHTVEGSGLGANVRQILGRDGEVWLPESGTDRLMRVRTSL